jgi:hypothetical protein
VKKSWRLALLSVLLAALLVSPSIACWPWSGGEDTLRLWDVGPLTLDPAISADMSSHAYVMQIFSGLVRLDHELNIVPDIAESWESAAALLGFSLSALGQEHEADERRAEAVVPKRILPQLRFEVGIAVDWPHTQGRTEWVIPGPDNGGSTDSGKH